MRKIIALMISDFKSIIREPMLGYMLAGPIIYTLIIRFSIPILQVKLSDHIYLPDYNGWIVGFFALMTPLLMGMVVGFMLLDERDEHVLMTLIVTPLGKSGYLSYRLGIPVLISLLYSMILLPALGLMEISFVQLFLLAVVVALEAPLVALFLANWAGNKVEGLALSKGLGLLLMAPMVSLFIKNKWSLLAGIIPFYWPVQAIVKMNEGMGTFLIYLGIGFMIHLIYFSLFLRRFQVRIF
ncbi:MAG: hypothetical protein ACOYVK_22085 [Bacillota bacterium]